MAYPGEAGAGWVADQFPRAKGRCAVPGPWLTDLDVEDRLAGVLNLTGGRAALEPFWLGIIPAAHRAGYNEVVGALAARGYSVAQMDSWDRREEFEAHLSLWWALVEGESEREGAETSTRPTMVPRLLFKFDRRLELATVPLTAGGVLMVPPTPASQAKVVMGQMDTSKDIFQLDPDVPNPWEPGYEYRR